ncbi:MAG: hemolysin family protein [Alphaproteobacteria bacterium]|nr:hemolysin family protein [Alphaproteobacteria bacterium]MCL2505683.1 hemolysin family protein [Alphaproteobacteria bacterium]
MTFDESQNPETSPAESEVPRTFWKKLGHKVSSVIRPKMDAQDLRKIVEEIIEEPSHESGVSSDEKTLLSNVVNLHDRRIEDCMVQRASIVALEFDSSLSETIEKISQSQYSRLPVYKERLDEVIGIIHVKDIIPYLIERKPFAIKDIIRTVPFVAPSMPVVRLLLQMRQTRQHMAMVVDEFGGIDGLITIEDLVEEIVGEIEDEHDEPDNMKIITLSDGSLIVDAGMPIEKFEADTGIKLSVEDNEEIDTIGGYAAHLAGHIPIAKESITCANGTVIEVLETEQSRILKVKIKK